MSMQLSTFKNPFGNNKAKKQHWLFALHVDKKVLTKHSIVIFTDIVFVSNM